jgi:hypothetical protein
VQAVTIPACPAGTTPVPSPPEPLALSNGRVGAVAWLQAVLLTLLAWAALLCIGLAGSVGAASQTLANKLAINAQHLQRHGGTSLASRAVRHDQPAVTSVHQIAEDSRAVVLGPTDGALLAADVTLPIDAQRADEPQHSATEPRLTPRNRAHPSRAPPVLA